MELQSTENAINELEQISIKNEFLISIHKKIKSQNKIQNYLDGSTENDWN